MWQLKTIRGEYLMEKHYNDKGEIGILVSE